MIIDYIYYLGVFVFAISGALSAAKKQLDWIGATALALATALGGGTFRDLILNRTVFWVEDPIYIWISVFGSCFTILYLKYFKPPHKALLLFDAIGLAFFTILGVKITSENCDSIAIIVLLSLFTGVLGGIIRDILSNDVPFLFRSSETLYSVSALAGILVYLSLSYFSLNTDIVNLVSISTITSIRLSSIYFNITLPSLKIGKE